MKPIPAFSPGFRSATTGLGFSLLIVLAAAPAIAQTNTRTGVKAGAKITTGTNNTANGFEALGSNLTGSFNTAVGSSSLKASTGTNNTAVGFQSLFRNKTGGFNTAVGDGALLNNLSGSFNIAIGEDSGFRNKTGSNNIHIGNKGLASDSGNIRIGTPGVHKNTFLSGVVRGNGSGLTNIPAARITGKIAGSQIAPNAISSTVLSSNLVLAGNTTGTFTGGLTGDVIGNLTGNVTGNLTGDVTGNVTGNLTGDVTGNLTGNASTATNASGILAANHKLSVAATGSFGQSAGFQFDGTTPGLLLETSTPNESGGMFLSGSTAVIYSPGDTGNVLSVFDEDQMSAVTPVAGFRVLNGNGGIVTPGNVTFGSTQVSAVGSFEQLRVLRGTVESDAISGGSGFTLTKVSTGVYRINFSAAFPSIPTTTVTAENIGAPEIATVSAQSASQVTIRIWSLAGTAVDSDFEFIVIGQR